MEFNGTFLATIITFVLFVFIMNKILYQPILGIMEKRRGFIESNYLDAKNNESRAEEMNAERDDKLNGARENARAKYVEFVNGFKSESAEEIAAAQESARMVLDKSKGELKQLSDDVKDSLKLSMTTLASDIVEKVIGYRSEVQGFDNDKVSSVLWGTDN